MTRPANSGGGLLAAKVEAFRDLSGVEQRIDKSKEFPIDSLAANDGVERFKRVVLDIVSAAKSSTND